MSSRQFHRWNLQSLSKMLKRASVMERGFLSSPQTMSYPHKCQQRSGKHVLSFTSVNSTLIWGEGLMKRYLFKYLIICMGSCTFVQSFQRILSMIVVAFAVSLRAFLCAFLYRCLGMLFHIAITKN